MSEAPYLCVIERGHTAVNDFIIDYLKPRIRAPYLDIGCNAGWLLSEVPGGVGVDRSAPLVQMARSKGLNVRLAGAECLPFVDREFATAVLSCVLEQCPDPEAVIREAKRVALRVIGVNPVPGSYPWGYVGGWVRSVIPESRMQSWGFRTERMDSARYFFESVEVADKQLAA